ncbi:MAG: ABC transporter permease subunit [Clostridium sp.]
MLRLVKAELFKLFKNKTFKVLCLVSIVLSIMMMLSATPIMKNIMMDVLGSMPEQEKSAMLEQLGNSKNIIEPGKFGLNLIAKDIINPTALEIYHSSFGTGLIEVLIGILIAALFAKEYTEGTIKNTLAYGKKRAEFYIAKFLAITIGTVFFISILTSIATIGAIIIKGFGQPFEISQLGSMFLSFIGAIIANAAVISLLMIIAITVKSNGGTIAITSGIFILVPTIISFIYGTYPLFDRIYELTPFYNSALATSIYATNGDIVRSILVALVTIGLSLTLGIQIFKKQDIK